MNEEKKDKKITKQWKGEVVSKKMEKTIIVKVDQVKFHPRYGKKMTVSKRYKVHCVDPDVKVGDTVIFVECRPLSHDKKWRFLSKVK
jgi:small subunit ribosomal protein S17